LDPVPDPVGGVPAGPRCRVAGPADADGHRPAHGDRDKGRHLGGGQVRVVIGGADGRAVHVGQDVVFDVVGGGGKTDRSADANEAAAATVGRAAAPGGDRRGIGGVEAKAVRGGARAAVGDVGIHVVLDGVGRGGAGYGHADTHSRAGAHREGPADRHGED